MCLLSNITQKATLCIITLRLFLITTTTHRDSRLELTPFPVYYGNHFHMMWPLLSNLAEESEQM